MTLLSKNIVSLRLMQAETLGSSLMKAEDNKRQARQAAHCGRPREAEQARVNGLRHLALSHQDPLQVSLMTLS